MFDCVALLYEKLNAVKRKRDTLREEVERETRETPAEEKERLLRQAGTFNFYPVYTSIISSPIYLCR